MIELKGHAAAPRMAALKTDLEAILGLFDPKSRIYYVDYPVHSNIGDLLINIGTEQFFLDHNIAIAHRFSVLNMPALSNLEVDRDTTFLCHGGGNFGDLYPKHQRLREELIEAFPHARIVFLPQSLHFSSKQAQQTSLERLARHGNCHVLLRDEESLAAIRDAGIEHASMMPDMAHQLWQAIQPTQDRGSRQSMYFRRRDMEATSVPEEFTDAFANGSVDWRDIVSTTHRILGGGVYQLQKSTGRLLLPGGNVAMWYAVRDVMIRDAVSHFSKFDRVITNRLHAMLLALLLGRDVSAFDNSYGKLSRYTNQWLSAALT